MNIYEDISQIVGYTPLLQLNKVARKADILLKLEFFNPTSSVKDRIAVEIINEAETHGLLKPGGHIVEATSGNTGLGLAMVAAARGYKLSIVMPESMSLERRALLKQFGAKLILTDPALGMKGAVEIAEKMNIEQKNIFMPRQFENKANLKAHYRTTGPEIWNDTAGEVDVFVAGIGTGGTISGTGKFLKEQNQQVKIIAVEPAGSAVLSGEAPGKHMIQGIGAGFVPEILQKEIIDKVVRIEDDEAFKMAKRLCREEGFLCGISSGCNVAAALKIAAMPEFKGKKIVTVACDTGERYLSTELFDI